MAKKTRRIAVLDPDGHLVNARQVSETTMKLNDHEVDVDPGDLPLDGTYKWDGEVKSFIPLGHNIPLKSKRPPVSQDYAFYLAMREMQKHFQLPQETCDYLDWFEANLQKRNQERVLAERRRGRKTTVLSAR